MINSDYPQPTHPRRTAEDQAKSPPSFPKPATVNLTTPCLSVDCMRVYEKDGINCRKIKHVLVICPRLDSDGDESDSESDSSSSCSSGMDIDRDVKMKPGEEPQQRQEDDNKKQEEENIEEAYWIRRTIADALYGKIKVATILKKRNVKSNTTTAEGEGRGVEWQITDKKCAIKCMKWKTIKKHAVSDNPLTEVLAMHLIKQKYANQQQCNTTQNNGDINDVMMNTHVIFPIDILEDEKFLYIVMPYGDEEVCQRLIDKTTFEEDEARYWMDQLFTGLETLQNVGVCHRDLSLENLVLCDNQLLIIDMGLSLRVPFYEEDDNHGTNAMDVDSNHDEQHSSARKQKRYLIRKQKPCGKAHYMSPEIYHELPFDGYTVDLWAAGVILFIMLTGTHPWDLPSTEYMRYRQISSGHLKENLDKRHLGPLSSDAVDLLQKMMLANPRERLSLEQVRNHPWMLKEKRSVSETAALDPRLLPSAS